MCYSYRIFFLRKFSKKKLHHCILCFTLSLFKFNSLFKNSCQNQSTKLYCLRYPTFYSKTLSDIHVTLSNIQ